MSMTVARRNRVWTPSLRSQFVKEVEALRAKNPNTKCKDTFSEIGHKWGLASSSAGILFYAFRSGKTTATRPTTGKRSYAPTTSLKDESGNIQSAITLLKKMGATITF